MDNGNEILPLEAETQQSNNSHIQEFDPVGNKHTCLKETIEIETGDDYLAAVKNSDVTPVSSTFCCIL